MEKYIKAHQKMLQEKMDQSLVDEALIRFHKERIQWVQHERLCHLLVFLFTLAATISFFALSLIRGDIWLFFVVALLVVLSVFYALHYFFLENSVQEWYQMTDDMEKSIDNHYQ